jgi:hypothetical protein
MRGLEVKRGLGCYVESAGVLLAALCLVCTPVFAQETKDSPHFAGGVEKLQPLPPGGPAPRTADGHPDLSGLWYPNSGGTEIQSAYLSASPGVLAAKRQFDPKVTPEGPPSFKPGIDANYAKTTAPRAQYGTHALSPELPPRYYKKTF